MLLLRLYAWNLLVIASAAVKPMLPLLCMLLPLLVKVLLLLLLLLLPKPVMLLISFSFFSRQKMLGKFSSVLETEKDCNWSCMSFRNLLIPRLLVSQTSHIYIYIFTSCKLIFPSKHRHNYNDHSRNHYWSSLHTFMRFMCSITRSIT